MLLGWLAKAFFGPPLGVFSYEQGTKKNSVYLNGKEVPQFVLNFMGFYVMSTDFDGNLDSVSRTGIVYL